jgi:acetyl-CoA carboxylase carboxyl transferase subunit alpha
VVGGFGTSTACPSLVRGHQKGRSTKEKVLRNFGQPKPEGYRKALRLMELAARTRRPIICLIDTQGAYPASTPRSAARPRRSRRTWRVMAGLPVPIVCAVIGEGGSGGALALGVANRILMQEYATYSVISPEGCASILWRDDGKKPEAAAAMKITATDLQRLGVVDEVVPKRRRRAPRPRRVGDDAGRGAAPPPQGALLPQARGAARGPLQEVPPHGRVRRVGRQGK